MNYEVKLKQKIKEFLLDGSNHWNTLSSDEKGSQGSHYTSFEMASDLVRYPIENLYKNRTSIDDLTIVDPACGMGALLVVSAFHLATNLSKDPKDLESVFCEILKENSYGIDLNPRTIKAVNLLFEDHFGVSPNFKVGNALLGLSQKEVISELRSIGVRQKPHPFIDLPVVNDFELDKDLYDFVFLSKYGTGDITLDLEILRDRTHSVWNKIKKLSKDNFLFHWDIEFPEIFQKDGFDLLIANPPFLGDRKQGSFSELVKNVLGTGLDLSAHFFQRYDYLVNESGVASSLATNSICQSKHRNRVLKPMFDSEFDCYRAVKSRIWGQEANVNVSMIHLKRKKKSEDLYLDKGSGRFNKVEYISSYLDEYPDFELEKLPQASQNSLRVFRGKCLRGNFSIHRQPEQSAFEAIADIPEKERDALAAYLNARMVQQKPRPTPADVVIDFFEPLKKAELANASAGEQLTWLEKHYPTLLKQLRTRSPHALNKECVFEQRIALSDSSSDSSHKEFWWLYGSVRQGLREAWKDVGEVVAFPVVTKVWTPFRLTKKIEISSEVTPTLRICPMDMLFIAPQFDAVHLAITTSFVFEMIVRRQCASLKSDLRFTSTNVFPYFPWPWLPKIKDDELIVRELPETKEYSSLTKASEKLIEIRTSILENPTKYNLTRLQIGGHTDLYNIYDSDPDGSNPVEGSNNPQIQMLRQAHVDLLDEVLRAYGWEDLLPINWVFDRPWLDQSSRFVPDSEARLKMYKRIASLNQKRSVND